MSTKALIQKVRAEIEAHENRGWLKGYAEGLATREQEVKVLQEALAARNKKIRELKHQKNDAQSVSTPDPEPDWLDAPAVLAHLDYRDFQQTAVFTPTSDNPERWTRADTAWTFQWDELRDVTPLYPKEDA